MEGFAELDPTDLKLRAEYERAFYDAFAPVTGNRLVRQLWLWDDVQRRLATRIGYEDQVVYVLRDGEDRIRVGLAVNRTLARFQSAAFGFPQPETGDHVFEFLAFFAPAPRPPRSIHLFGIEAIDLLRARGFRIGFATTAPPLLPLYRRLGFRVLGKRTISGEIRYFITLPLAQIDLPRLEPPLPGLSITLAESPTEVGSERKL